MCRFIVGGEIAIYGITAETVSFGPPGIFSSDPLLGSLRAAPSANGAGQKQAEEIAEGGSGGVEVARALRLATQSPWLS